METMTQISPEGDDELLLRLRSGDEQAFLALYHRRHGALYRFAVHLSGSKAVAEDIVQVFSWL
jgi:DNA-directed RNA polymerase specialized sigma24 family protein